MGRKHDKKEEASIILEILNRIPLSKRFVSVDDILNSLASAEIDVSRRSLQRYLKQMYDCGKYGLVRDNRGNAYGYRRERTDSITDSIHLKPNECLLLRIAQEHMKYQIPGTVLKSLGFLFDAASEMLKEKGSNAKENQWLNKVCVISSSIPQMPSKVLPRIFDARFRSSVFGEETQNRIHQHERQNHECCRLSACTGPAGCPTLLNLSVRSF